MRPLNSIVALFLTSILSAQTSELSVELAKAKKEFAAADAKLNEAYNDLRSRLDETRKTELLKLQRDWLRYYRDGMAEDQPRQIDSKWIDKDPKDCPEFWQCRTELTKERILFFRAFEGKNAQKGLSGVYDDFVGGTLELRETEAGLEFAIDVVRGPTHHLGGIDGVAKLHGKQATYQDKPDPKEEREPCRLTFKIIDDHTIQVVGENTSYYHGARAYFDGTFYKTGPMKATQPKSDVSRY